MADRRTSERHYVDPEELDHIVPDVLHPLVLEKPGERLIVPPDSLDRVSMDEKRRETDDRTEPMRLSFLALLAERDPLVQARLNFRRAHAAGPEAVAEEDRPTDPMILTPKFSAG